MSKQIQKKFLVVSYDDDQQQWLGCSHVTVRGAHVQRRLQ